MPQIKVSSWDIYTFCVTYEDRLGLGSVLGFSCFFRVLVWDRVVGFGAFIAAFSRFEGAK